MNYELLIMLVEQTITVMLCKQAASLNPNNEVIIDVILIIVVVDKRILNTTQQIFIYL